MTPTSPRLRELASEAEREAEQLDTEMREIEILLKQTASEIEKLQQRQTDAATRLRQVEANIEAYSRSDIKNAYAGTLDAQMRIFMMRSQLEQLQSKQRTLQRYRVQLDKLSLLASEASESVSTPSVTTVANADVSSDHQGIVHIIEAQEAERQRLSRQMHDGPAQSLTNLILQAEIVERMFDADPARARAELGNLKNSANTTFQRIRDFIFDLRPMMLDDLGLLPTLKRYVQTFESKTHLPIPMTTQGERALSPYLEMTIFRAIQELLNNAARHAHASRVQVNLDLQNDPIVVAVEDDGSGFDVATVLAAARQRGSSGLANLEKRITMLGGKIQFQSSTGRGTRVRVEIPAM
ncbi:MAG: sensor histidine kinase [Chloroflexi bacterium]|nr:sensor histidine kinase [Chloroflexota bacterium]